ncbi:MAG: curved DNA-binding protein, partial [Candidatus Solibacter sp.]|nr:curved DNA-binding protein [Candidatus Solibacter sp.]
MTHYEELGLPAGASREEIRRAYKHLVRLLHPDQCPEENTRRLADLQMKRLNAIRSVLMDPESRAAYD